MTVLKSSQKQQDKIMTEAKLLQIMIYKRRQQLRSEKSLQLLRRVGRNENSNIFITLII